MPHTTPRAFAAAADARRAGLALLLTIALPFAASGAHAADLSLGDEAPYAAQLAAGFGGGGYWAPLVPLRPAPTPFDIYGYPLPSPGLLGRPAPHAIGVGCPPALQPIYDPDGNLAGYAPLQYCR